MELTKGDRALLIVNIDALRARIEVLRKEGRTDSATRLQAIADRWDEAQRAAKPYPPHVIGLLGAAIHDGKLR